MGKGSAPRPYGVDHETFASNWDKIFGNRNANDNFEDKPAEPKERESGVKVPDDEISDGAEQD